MMMMMMMTMMKMGCAAQEQLQKDEDMAPDVSDFDLNFAPPRIPRQVKTILTKETKPHIQELSIRTTIISRYAFTAVYCVMLNRLSVAADATFHFHIPADAFVSNFTM
nr:inter-alpha-trypsin inhibitor heavy chain H5-like [Solea senegalensis]